MGFDIGCLMNLLSVLQECKGARGRMNYVDMGMKLMKMARPYVVQYLGPVNRPPRVDVNEAFNQAGETEGFKPWDAPSQKTGRFRALFIGINYFGTTAELSGCCNDVKQILGTLEKKKFPIDEMNILVDEKGFPGANGLPTRANIVRYLAWLVKDAKAGDVLFMHYSGHGTQARAAKDSQEAYDQCVAPVDFQQNGCILDDDIFKILLAPLPAGVRLTVVFDCCHSGSMLDLPYAFVATRALRSTVVGHMQRIRQGNNCAGDALMISGCRDDQTSADVTNTASFGTGAYGAGGAATQCLTYTILKTNKLSYQEMLIATRDMLKKKRFTQVPQLSASKPINMQGQFSLMDLFEVDTSVMD